MINNQSDTPEKFEPKDSEHKKPAGRPADNKAVVKPEDENCQEDSANFGNVAKKKENSDREKR